MSATTPFIGFKKFLARSKKALTTGGKRLFGINAGPQKQASEIPAWFQGYPSEAFLKEINNEKASFLWVPWIPEHGDKLISRLAGDAAYQFVTFDFVTGIEENRIRLNVLRFARENPALYRRMLLRRLVPIRSKIKGFVLTLDWPPVMRLIASVCQELEIPTILIPHESVFIDRDKYYYDITSHASRPICDVILGWGSLQKDIFVERGYDAERYLAVGAPKFDTYKNYDPELSREQFHNIFGLEASKKTILFATQHLDSQIDTIAARDAQRQAMQDILDYCAENNCQFIARLPPSKDDVLGVALRERINSLAYAAYDDAHCYVVSAEEAVHHCDLVASINSTMLFEGVLAGKPAVSIKYLEFSPFWEKAGIPAARNVKELFSRLSTFLNGGWSEDTEGMKWAAEMFGVGEFDGKAVERIRSYLNEVASDRIEIQKQPCSLERLHLGKPLDVAATVATEVQLKTELRYLSNLIGARWVENTSLGEPQTLASVEVFVDLDGSPASEHQRQIARYLGRPIIYLSQGLFEGIDSASSSPVWLSAVLDRQAHYYDARTMSGLERTVQTAKPLDDEQRVRARALIDRIVASRLTGTPRSSTFALPGSADRRKVLVVGQSVNDPCVAASLAGKHTFKKMLDAAMSENTDADIIVLRPKTDTDDFYDTQSIARAGQNVFVLTDRPNSYDLLDGVAKVYVASALIGFEALMAGREVDCFAMPFYAGWGMTNDRDVVLERRTAKPKLEDIFHYAFIANGRYVSPARGITVEIEALLTELSAQT